MIKVPSRKKLHQLRKKTVRHIAKHAAKHKGKISLALLLTGLMIGTGGILWVTNSILAQTFSGPQCSAGQCSGAISISGGAFAVGTSSPISDTKFFILASSTQSAGFAVKVLSPGAAVTNGNDGIVRGGPLLLIRNDGKIGIGGFIGDTTTSTVVIGGNTKVNGTLAATTLVGTLSGNLGAENIAAGSFGSIAGTGNYTFPSGVAIGTSTVGARLVVSDAGSYDIFRLNSRSEGGYMTFQQAGVSKGYLQWGMTIAGSGSGNYTLLTSGVNGGNIALQTYTGAGVYNSSALVVASTGNIGIATSSPAYALSVTGTIFTNTGYRFPDGTTQTTAATGAIGGSGTNTYIPKFNNAPGTSLGNSGISDNGTTVTIAGTSDPGLTVGNGSTGYLKIGASTCTTTAHISAPRVDGRFTFAAPIPRPRTSTPPIFTLATARTERTCVSGMPPSLITAGA
jgi:hypothetical protein